MDAEAIREFANRNRTLVEEEKRRHWAVQYRRLGPEVTWAAGQRLREHMSVVRPDWPTAQERADDLAHHIELKRKLDRTAGARRTSRT